MTANRIVYFFAGRNEALLQTVLQKTSIILAVNRHTGEQVDNNTWVNAEHKMKTEQFYQWVSSECNKKTHMYTRS